MQAIALQADARRQLDPIGNATPVIDDQPGRDPAKHERCIGQLGCRSIVERER